MYYSFPKIVSEYDQKISLSDIMICYMTGENPVSWLAQFVFITLDV